MLCLDGGCKVKAANQPYLTGSPSVSAAFGALMALLDALIADSSWREADLVSGLLSGLCLHLEPGTTVDLSAKLEKILRRMPRPVGQNTFCRTVAKLLLALTAGELPGGSQLPPSDAVL